MISYLCPICKSPLLDQGKDAVCKNGHLFDRAKEGYFYLLPPKSNAPGDNAEMVRARRDFLDCGFYVPLASAITDEINALFQRPVTLLDAGCGTGFYLSEIIEKRQNDKDVYVAIDISKNAVKICAKRNERAECDVATALPASSLELVDKKEISYSFDLTTSKQICDLLTMTPYVYRAPKASVENVKSKTGLDLTADFCMCTLKKTSR